MTNNQTDHSIPEELKNFFAKDLFALSIGIKLLEVKPGFAMAELELTEKHLNALNIVQGGAIFTLADFTFAAATNSESQATVAVNANITYFRAPRGKKLIAKASEVSTQKRLVTYNVDVFDEKTELIARVTGLGYRKRND